MTGWWASAARALALVLVLAVAVPAAGLAEDLTFHQGHRDGNRTELTTAPGMAPGGTQTTDPGLGCHLHCSCHIVAMLEGIPAPSPVPASRQSYARTAEAVPSVFPDRLPRPPRA